MADEPQLSNEELIAEVVAAAAAEAVETFKRFAAREIADTITPKKAREAALAALDHVTDMTLVNYGKPLLTGLTYDSQQEREASAAEHIKLCKEVFQKFVARAARNHKERQAAYKDGKRVVG